MEGRLWNYTIDIKLLSFPISCAHLQLPVYSSLIPKVGFRSHYPSVIATLPSGNNSTALPQTGDMRINASNTTGTVTTEEEMHQSHVFHSLHSYDHLRFRLLWSVSIILHLWTDSVFLPLKKGLFEALVPFSALFLSSLKITSEGYGKQHAI